MKIPFNSAVLGAVLLASACSYSSSFVPSAPSFAPFQTKAFTRSTFVAKLIAPTELVLSRHATVDTKIRPRKTRLQMSAEDFSEGSYTEAAWAAVAALPKVADFYSATTVEAPMLLDVLLNPAKHSAGENAEAAKLVVDKVLAKAGVSGRELRQQLENYMAKQPKISGSAADNAQKNMGRSLQKVLEAARNSKAILSVSSRVSCAEIFIHIFF